MTLLHARVDVVEGELDTELVGAPAGIRERTFAVLTLTDEDGQFGAGEASPLPSYSPDGAALAIESLREVVASPVEVDEELPARALLDRTPEVQLASSPAARFAIETAILDWLGKRQGAALHRLLSSGPYQPVDVAALVFEPEPERWPDAADRLVADGRKHLKFKIGGAFDEEVDALSKVRAKHPSLSIRLDANQRLSFDALDRHRDALDALSPRFIEEPVPPASMLHAGALGLPLALDESLRDESTSRAMLPNPNLVALVIKPSIVGGVTAALDLAKIARAHGCEPILSHVFEGPIARAACAEVALSVGAVEAQGLGAHPCLDLWPRHRIAALESTTIRPHGEPGLGLTFEELADA